MLFFKKKNTSEIPSDNKGNTASTEDYFVEGQVLYDIAKVHEVARGDMNFFKKLLNIFITQIPDTLLKMSDAFDRNDFEAIKGLSHKIKPSVVSLGIVTIVSDLNDLEMGYNSDEAERKLRKVTAILNEVIKGLKMEIEATS